MIQIHKENGRDDDAGQIIGWYYNFHYNYIAGRLVLEIFSTFFGFVKPYRFPIRLCGGGGKN